MDSTQVQRTLVKSPPELWAELSDPAALARHLGELGEIRITRIEPEHKVEWAAESARGTVLIKPSAWGTRVTLTASRERGGPESAPVADRPSHAKHSPPPASPEADPGPPAGGAEPAAHRPISAATVPARAIAVERPTPSTEAHIAADREPAAAEAIAATPEPAEPEPAEPESSAPPCTPEPSAGEPEPAHESRRRFFTRLLRRWRPQEPAEPAAHASQPLEQGALAARPPRSSSGRAGPETVAPPRPAADQPSVPVSDAPHASAADEPPKPPDDGPSNPPAHEPGVPVSDLAHEGQAPAAATAEGPADEVAAVLTSVLDRLGAAHHRPFSRA